MKTPVERDTETEGGGFYKLKEEGTERKWAGTVKFLQRIKQMLLDEKLREKKGFDFSVGSELLKSLNSAAARGLHQNYP